MPAGGIFGRTAPGGMAGMMTPVEPFVPPSAGVMEWLKANPNAGQDQPMIIDRGAGVSASDAHVQFNKWLRDQQRKAPPVPSNDVSDWEEFMRSYRPEGGAMVDAYGRRLPMQYWLGV